MMKYILILAMFYLASPAFAQDGEVLNLFPKERAAYLERSERNAERYQAEGYNYIENLYEYQGEGGETAETRLPESEIDDALNSAHTVESSQGANEQPPAIPQR